AAAEIGPYSDREGIKAFAMKHNIDLAVVGSEAPIAEGVVDALKEVGIVSASPTKAMARLETSKGFTRSLMQKYGIAGLPKFRICSTMDEAQEFAGGLAEIVVKPDGLTGGKGVKVQGDHFATKEEGLSYAQELMHKGGSVLIEEKLDGEEFSLQSFTDGTTVTDCPPVQDHKRAYADDKGPNTGGMGSYTTGRLLPFMTEQDLVDAHGITVKVAQALKKELGKPYVGIMYGGFIITKDGVRLIEYNARFGDPEAMNVLPILRSDIVELFRRMVEGTLHEMRVEFDPAPTVCKYAVPKGYPEHPVKGEAVDVSAVPKDAMLYYASVAENNRKLIMSASRAIAVVGIGRTIEEAERLAQIAVESIRGPIAFRKDIGTKKLLQKRIEHMAAVKRR
ncbi:TPA: phosphoribosylamine--glycine ligase, partial [Candidatus Woesearchaeota archaeon]|nr:phosphoribosylamine--glycine ligase [Candidatus Woesearchaeota archaeon]